MATPNELKDQGLELYGQYEYERAMQAFEQAKDAYNEAGREDMAAEMLANIGMVHRALGQGQPALDAMGSALKIFQKLSDTQRVAQVMANMGGVYAKMNDKEQAYNIYRQAADIFDELGEKEMYGQTLLAMGKLQLDEGKFMAGATTYQVALENVENPTWQQRMIKNLGGTVNKIMGSDTPIETEDDKPDKKDDAAS